jgi:hypothetical protein
MIWDDIGNTVLELAYESKAKDFMSHHHVQRYIDEVCLFFSHLTLSYVSVEIILP